MAVDKTYESDDYLIWISTDKQLVAYEFSKKKMEDAGEQERNDR